MRQLIASALDTRSMTYVPCDAFDAKCKQTIDLPTMVAVYCLNEKGSKAGDHRSRVRLDRFLRMQTTKQLTESEVNCINCNWPIPPSLQHESGNKCPRCLHYSCFDCKVDHTNESCAGNLIIFLH